MPSGFRRRDAAPTAYRYFGGPWDGRPVLLEPGWPAPDAMEHDEWPDGHYRKDERSMRYVWRTAEWRAGPVTTDTSRPAPR